MVIKLIVNNFGGQDKASKKRIWLINVLSVDNNSDILSLVLVTLLEHG